MLKIGKSKIHGKGLFTTKNIKRSVKICLVIDRQNIIYPAKYINHSEYPNCILYQINNKYYLYSFKHILPNQELTINYNKAPYFINKI